MRQALVVLALAPALAAPAAAALSPAQYRTRAVALCKRADATTTRASKGLDDAKTPTRAQLLRAFSALASAERTLAVRFRALDPPAPLRAEHAHVIALVLRDPALTTRLVARVRAGAALATIEAAPEVVAAKKVTAQIRAGFRRLGLAGCMS